MLPEHECNKEGDFATIFTTLTFVEKFINEIKQNDLPHIYKTLSEIKEKMDNRRPTYTTMWIITFLASLCTGLLVTIVKK
mgnify:CR=1 FL=1